MLKRMMLLVLAIAVLGMVFGGCSVARRDIEIERLRLQNDALRKSIGRGINLKGPGFNAELSAYGHDNLLERVIPGMIGEEAAKAELYRMKTAAVKRAVFSEGAVDRRETTVHFWFDEKGREWVRGYWHNISAYTLKDLMINGISVDNGVTIPSKLKPGEKTDYFWALVGTTVYVTATKVNSRGKMVGRVDYKEEIHSAELDPVDEIDGMGYHWAVVTRW